LLLLLLRCGGGYWVGLITLEVSFEVMKTIEEEEEEDEDDV